ncbi:MAG: hypothetical protein KDA22_11570 [Phycisphaerales bacterium]|nr:hypothetical protein [Phycisphaerales bacterium]
MTRYLSKLVELGALGAWMLDEPSGTTAEDLIGANDGSYNGSYTLAQASLAENGDYASVDLAGGSGGGYVSVPNDLSYETAEVTWAVHAHIDAKVTSSDILSLRDSNVNNGGFVFAEMQAGGAGRCFFRILTNWRSVDIAAGDIPIGESAFWVYRYDGEFATVFKDGVQVAVSASYPGVINWGSGTNTLQVGRNPTSAAARHNGRVQGVAVFGYALSDAEILALYQSTVLPSLTPRLSLLGVG